jgi:hypothetical protein
MSESTFARKKTATSDFSHSSLVSSTTPTLANPTRGFGLPTNNLIQTATDLSTEQQEVQSADNGSLEQLTIQEKPLSHDISRISFSRLQAKLTVGEPGDQYEQEADWMANRVMGMSDHAPQVQRLEEDENPVQMSSLAQSITPVVQRAFQGGGNQTSGDLESRLHDSKGGGSPLAPEVQAFMEPRFGSKFNNVRVHTGGEAVQMSKDLGAQAFTHGSDVYFGEGKAPGNNELTAHELTHVVQQTGMVQKAPKKASKFEAIKDILNTIPTGQSALKLMEDYKVKVVFKKGGGSYYDSSSVSMVIDSNESPADAALTFVHEMNHARYDKEGITGKAKDQSRDDYVKQMVEEEAEGTVKSIEAKIELEGGGTVDVSKAFFPLEKQYRQAYNARIKEEEAKFPGKEKSVVGVIKLLLPGLARDAGKKRVIKGFMDGEVVTSNTNKPYKDYYGEYWDKVNKKKK